MLYFNSSGLFLVKLDILKCVSGIWTCFIWLWWFVFGLEPIFTYCLNCLKKYYLL